MGMKQILVMMAVVLVGCGKSDEEKYAESRTATAEAFAEKYGAMFEGGLHEVQTTPEPSSEPHVALSDDEKLIADPIVETAVREELKKPEGELTEADLKKVTHLSFYNTKITDAGLKEVAKLQKLEWLSLAETQITDAGLKEVAKLQNLERLVLSDTQITDTSLKEVVKLQKLEWLFLSRTQITDAGLKELSKLQKLEWLILDDTQITDAGLKEVAKLPKLGWLYLSDTKITKAGAAELKKALPNCRIEGP